MNRLHASRLMPLMLSGVALTLSVTAQASMMKSPDHEMYSATALVTAPTVTIAQLEFASAGTINVLLKDLAWPDLAQSLSFSLSEPLGVLARLTSPGVLTYDLTGPATLFASVYAAPAATARAALYHLQVSFTAAPPVPHVPLPAGVWLLISGIAGLGAVLRKRSSHTAVTHA
jgi:hypothetical protein